MQNNIFNTELSELILKILKKGDSVELKRENGRIVVVEIQRKAKYKTSVIG